MIDQRGQRMTRFKQFPMLSQGQNSKNFTWYKKSLSFERFSNQRKKYLNLAERPQENNFQSWIHKWGKCQHQVYHAKALFERRLKEYNEDLLSKFI